MWSYHMQQHKQFLLATPWLVIYLFVAQVTVTEIMESNSDQLQIKDMFGHAATGMW